VPTIRQIIEGLLPDGSRADDPLWKGCPVWPPDAFAVAATLVARSACYAKFRVGSGAPRRYVTEVRKDGRDWIRIWNKAKRYPTEVPARVQSYWDTLAACDEQVAVETRGGDRDPPWWNAAMRLLAASDEACEGVGFDHDPEPGDTRDPTSALAKAVRMVRTVLRTKEERERILRDSTICRRVKPEIACVQPKSRTAQVGCTLRSLSHHLALLPASGEARAEWFLPPVRRSGQLNLLLVPFPYRIPSRSFEPRFPDKTRTGHYFGVSPDHWLYENGLRVGRVVEFLSGLVDEAKKQGGVVHGIVLPELALDIDTAQKAAATLGEKYKGELELFISGVAASGRNAVYTVAYDEQGAGVWPWIQPKHHKWRLDAGQICRYRLAHVLDPSKLWWEDTKLGERFVRLLVFRHGATISALVCEDLARTDPAQALLRSLGPNLVLALLMDGPQVQPRWPGQYATVLAEDPGSSVLTLTSLGMVRRAHTGALRSTWQVALWKEYGSSTAEEIHLDEGAHALLATLFVKTGEETTLDGRSDGGTAMRVSFGQCRQVTHKSPPDWIRELCSDES
jgi:hypothetical protein